MDHRRVDEGARRYSGVAARDAGVQLDLRLGRTGPRVGLRDKMKQLAVIPGQNRVLIATQPTGAVHDRIEDRLQLVRRPRHDAQNFGNRCLIFERLLQLSFACLLSLKQARVLDSNHGLLRKVGNELDLFIGEGFNMTLVDGDCANHPVSSCCCYGHGCTIADLGGRTHVGA
jgi:hypothetical protein